MSGCCGPVIIPPAPEPVRYETRLGAQTLAAPVVGGAVPSVDIQARVAAAGGVLQSVVITGGPPQSGGCERMVSISTSDGTAWVDHTEVVRLDAVDPSVGIVGPVVASCCNPGGRGDAFWTYTVPVTP